MKKPTRMSELFGMLQVQNIEKNKQQDRGGLEAEMNGEQIFDGINDIRCPHAIGDLVKKRTFESGDIHQIGHKGKVLDNLHLPKDSVSVYLVQFEGDIHVCFTLGYKIEKQ